jgi:dethiobiotin synthetase
MRRLFVTAIGTDIGKTAVSAILTEALQADYWKPVQCGSVEATDSDFVRSHVSNPKTVVHAEAFLFREPVSPHLAASLEGKEIVLKAIKVPETQNSLIIEGAGGLLVPLNNTDFVIDMIPAFDAEAVVVVKHYLGSINHSMLTLEALKSRGIKIAGIIFNGDRNPASEGIILQHHSFDFVGYVREEEEFTKDTVLKYAGEFQGI